MKTNEGLVVANIVKIRNNQGVSKRELAKALNINEASYGRIESGKIALSYDYLAKIAGFFGLREIDIITYPDVYEKREINTDAPQEPVEAILQIKLQKSKKDQVLKLIFGENDIEILNK